MTMHWVDYAIVLIPFVVILVVSWSTRRYMRSVADFMSASRCAGRYLICTASGEAAFGVVGVLVGFEYVWSIYWHITSIVLPLLIGIITTVWLTWGWHPGTTTTWTSRNLPTAKNLIVDSDESLYLDFDSLKTWI